MFVKIITTVVWCRWRNAWCWVLGSWVFVPVFHAHSTPIVSLSSFFVSVLVSLFCVPTVSVTLFSVCLHISAFFSFYSSNWKVSLLYPVLLSIFFPSLFLPVADWCTSPLFLAVCHHVISSQCMYTPTFLFVMASVFLPSFVPMVLHVFSSSLCSCLVFFVFCTIFQQPNKLLTFSYFSCLRLLPLGALHSKSWQNFSFTFYVSLKTNQGCVKFLFVSVFCHLS